MASEFLFDVTIKTSIRVTADTAQEARDLIFERIDCAETNFGAWPNGDPILAEATAHVVGRVLEVDGEAT